MYLDHIGGIFSNEGQMPEVTRKKYRAHENHEGSSNNNPRRLDFFVCVDDTPGLGIRSLIYAALVSIQRPAARTGDGHPDDDADGHGSDQAFIHQANDMCWMANLRPDMVTAVYFRGLQDRHLPSLSSSSSCPSSVRRQAETSMDQMTGQRGSGLWVRESPFLCPRILVFKRP